MMAAMAAAVKAGLGMDGIGQYVSRGKGRAGGQASVKTRNRGKTYPFSSARRHDQCAAFQYNKVVNGFEIMQTRSTAEARAHHIRGTA